MHTIISECTVICIIAHNNNLMGKFVPKKTKGGKPDCRIKEYALHVIYYIDDQ